MKLNEITPAYPTAELYRFKQRCPSGEELEKIKEKAKIMKWERAIALYGDEEVLQCCALDDARCMAIVIFKPIKHKQSNV
jgi:hypothetical protein